MLEQWNSMVEQWNSMVERGNSVVEQHGRTVCHSVMEKWGMLWWNSVTVWCNRGTV